MYRLELKNQIDELYRTFGREYLSSDPVQFVHRYRETRDREIAGLIAAALAYGNVAQICRSVERVLAVMHPSPYRFIKSFDPVRHAALFENFRHRFNVWRDVALLLYFLKQVFAKHDTLGNFFRAGFDPADDTIERGLCSFAGRLYALDSGPFFPAGIPADSSARYLLSSPEKKSACKRMNMFLRWMVRRDGCDFGLWTFVSPAQLVMPLDTHTSRICRYIGLTGYKTVTWKTALDVTENLRRFDPVDPVKYDFAVSRLGILNRCGHRFIEHICGKCLLSPMCLHARGACPAA